MRKGHLMTFQEEQAQFQKQIDENFISLFDLINNIRQEKELSFTDASLFLLTRINNYIGNTEENRFRTLPNEKKICCQLVDPPFERYSLDYISNYELVDVLKFAVKNGRFRSEKKAKTYGLIKSEIENALSGISQTEIKQESIKDYHPNERDTHLQMIAILAEELAAKLPIKYRKANGLPNNSAIAELIGMRAKEIEIESLTSKSVDTYRRRLTEISKFYKGE